MCLVHCIVGEWKEEKAEGMEEPGSEDLKGVGCLLKAGICTRLRGLEGTR